MFVSLKVWVDRRSGESSGAIGQANLNVEIGDEGVKFEIIVLAMSVSTTMTALSFSKDCVLKNVLYLMGGLRNKGAVL